MKLSRVFSPLTSLAVLIILILSLFSSLVTFAQDDPLSILMIAREGNTTYTRNFNPFSPAPLNGTTTAIYERMIIWNPINGDLVPWLATNYAWSEDCLSLTFTGLSLIQIGHIFGEKIGRR